MKINTDFGQNNPNNENNFSDDLDNIFVSKRGLMVPLYEEYRRTWQVLGLNFLDKTQIWSTVVTNKK